MALSSILGRRVAPAMLTVVASLLAGGAGPSPAGARPTPRRPPSVPIGGPGPVVPPTGANLLRNPAARSGAASIGGWDSVTIPAWRVAAGLPTVVAAGTRDFPATGPRMFVGGAGGTARLVQSLPLRPTVATGTRFTLSARLGASATSDASLRVTFTGRSGRRLSTRTLGPVSGRARDAVAHLVARSLHGQVPRGADRAVVTLTLATRLRNIDGPYAPKVGYDRAAASDLDLSVSAAVRPPAPVRPPVSRVPRYRHVFLFYFENQDVRDIVGNRRAAPYYNRLLAQGTELGQMYAEEHPSDGNYLALAGGSVFGIPLDDPAEENSQYTIRAPNIGDRVLAAGETWAAYEQSATGPCDDTVHGFYWDDDLPMMYFADVRDRAAYCAAHVLPLEAMSTDLAQTATTPDFAWVGVNDCDDMEGCGIRAGDRFLADQLGQIMRSPAWRDQRSLAIITFDEDAVDHERPAQRIPTLILASQGVRRGFVSHVRYTHYSLLRTIEGALGLRSLTANDRFAQPLNDVFRRGEPGAVAPPSPYARVRAPSLRSRPAISRAAPVARNAHGTGPQTAFVVSSTTDRVTPITLATGRRGGPIPVGADPDAIALAPDDRTAYVVDSGSDDVTPIDTRTRLEKRPIPVGRDPTAIAIAPGGATAYVSNMLSDTVTPIDLHTGRALTPIPVGSDPRALAFSSDGRTLYVCDWGGGEVTPIDVAGGQALAPIPVGSYPIAVAARGAHAIIADSGSNAVTEIDTSTDRALRSVPAGQFPDALALTPDGHTAAVVDGDTDQLTELPVDSRGPSRRIAVGNSPVAVALSPSGRTAYVANAISSTVTPVDMASGRAERPIGVGGYAYPSAIAVAPGGRAAVVLDTYAGAVRLLWTRTKVVSAAIHVGGYPSAVAITR